MMRRWSHMFAMIIISKALSLYLTHGMELVVMPLELPLQYGGHLFYLNKQTRRKLQYSLTKINQKKCFLFCQTNKVKEGAKPTTNVVSVIYLFANHVVDTNNRRRKGREIY